MAFYYGGNHDESIQASLRVLEIDPKFSHSYEDLGRAYAAKRMWHEAITAFGNAVRHSGRGSRYVASLAHAYSAIGNWKKALVLRNALQRLSKKGVYVSPYGFALIETGMGNIDGAFKWLDKAYQERAGAVPFVNVDPRLAPLHPDPRFRKLLKGIHLVS